MSSGAINIIAIVLLLIPGILGQCIDCNAHWKFHCRTNYTGYYCAPGAQIHQKVTSNYTYLRTTSSNDTPYDRCTPYPFQIPYIETFCCLYSPKVGCQLALNPRIFHYEKLPVSRCGDCMEHCQCSNKGAPPVQSWTMVPHLGICVMLIQWMFL
ncbi:uncharacterized protein LOC108145130 [Drosophila elegans]|uniref:uncharacterized protein LOC108145130 n=1 Tax=Drosophila elegans TaxID=30023 RepID=UPI0007E72787|nr:uncharacterized protein LOC108145130 [Drosophila elegans]XP_017125836.1 uncharacterized protein LOC108145130 [Drosophila elegans]